jgi:hypothetical protein
MGDGFCNAAGGAEICATASDGHPISGAATIIVVMKRIAIKNPDRSLGFLILPYLLAVLSRKGRLVAVADTTVMSPLAPMV